MHQTCDFVLLDVDVQVMDFFGPLLDNQARGQCMIRVAKNLHKKQYSLRQGSKVVGYATHLTLRNCTFEVNEKTRQRVIRNRQKEVHAFVVGVPVDGVE